MAVAAIDRWPRTQAADSVRDAIQVHHMEEQGFHLIGFLKHGHPARVRGAVTLFGNYFSWDKTFTRDELFATGNLLEERGLWQKQAIGRTSPGV